MGYGILNFRYSAQLEKENVMGKIIAVVNQKGGVGKTTTVINLAAALVEKKYKILIVDIDPQGNATSGCGVMKNQAKSTIYDVLVNKTTINEVI